MRRMRAAVLELCLLTLLQSTDKQVIMSLSLLETKQAYLLNLCPNNDDACLELEQDQWCLQRQEAQRERYDTTVCVRETSVDMSGTAYTGACTYEYYSSTGSATRSLFRDHRELCQPPDSCISTPENNWPQLSYSLIYVDSHVFNVSINWTLVPVAGYSLIISRIPLTDCSGLPVVQCAVTTLEADATGFLYKHLNGYSERREAFHIKLIPKGWCDGPQVAVPVPGSCHNLCPGACDLCGHDNKLAPPTNVSLSLCRSPVSGKAIASVTWQPGEKYYRPYVNTTYYLSIWNKSMTVPIYATRPVSRHYEIVGRTSVILHNLALFSDQTYHIRVWPYDCVCDISKSGRVDFVMNQDTPLCLQPEPPSDNDTLLSHWPHPVITSSLPVVTSYPTTAHPSTIPSINSIAFSLDISVSLYSSPPVSPLPVSTLPMSTLPVSTPLVSTLPVSTLPVSTLPVSTPPVSTLPVSTLPVSTLPVSTPPVSTSPVPPASPNYLVHAVTLAIAMCALTFLVTIFIVCCSQRCRNKHTADSSLEQVQSELAPIQNTKVQSKVQKVKVMVVFSLDTPVDDIEYILENFAAPLLRYGIESIFYDPTHGRGGIPQWVEHSVSESTKVFLICNEQFKDEWNQTELRPVVVGGLVHVIREIFLAHISSSSEYTTKFSLLFLRASCFETCMPSRYLYNLQRFVVDPSNHSTIEQVARFVRNVKTYSLATS